MKRTIFAIAILTLTALTAPVLITLDQQRHIPQTREEMNQVFDQEVLAYLLIDDSPHVLVC